MNRWIVIGVVVFFVLFGLPLVSNVLGGLNLLGGFSISKMPIVPFVIGLFLTYMGAIRKGVAWHAIAFLILIFIMVSNMGNMLVMFMSLGLAVVNVFLFFKCF